MTLDSPITIFALAISPLVAVIFIVAGWFKRNSAARPSIVAAIPLALCSIAILLGQSAVTLLEAFNRIATRQWAGVGAVISGLLAAQGPLAWGLLDCGACLIAILLFRIFLQYQQDEETALIDAYVALPALIATAAIVAGLFAMVYVQYGTVDLVMKVVDNHRGQELFSEYGTASPAYFAAKISSRLVAVTFLSFSEFCVLLVVGFLNLFWRQQQNSRQRFAVALTVGVLIACGVSALSEFSFIDYLGHVR